MWNTVGSTPVHAISELTLASVSGRGLVRNLPCENEFDLLEKQPVEETHFHLNGFARGFVLTQGQKAPWKWPIALIKTEQ